MNEFIDAARSRERAPADRSANLSRIDVLVSRRKVVRRAVAAISCVLLISVGVWAFAPMGPNADITFADGSVAAFGKSKPEIGVEYQNDDVVVSLTNGEATFDVVSNLSRRFVVKTPDLSVVVRGTKFAVSHHERQSSVELISGVVEVITDHERVTLREGGQTSFDSRPVVAAMPAEGQRAIAPERLDVADRAPETETVEAQETNSKPSAPKKPTRVAAKKLTVDEMFDRSDRLRSEGKFTEAIALLRGISTEHSTDARAPLAHYTVATILSDNLNAPQKALPQFASFQTLYPGHALTEDAMVRQIETLAKLGRPDEASRLAAEYVRLYPKGTHTVRVRRFISN